MNRSVPLGFSHSRLARHLTQHVVYDLAVLVLRTEQNDLGVFTHSHRVSGRPVEQVAAVYHFLCVVCVGDGKFSLQ